MPLIPALPQIPVIPSARNHEPAPQETKNINSMATMAAEQLLNHRHTDPQSAHRTNLFEAAKYLDKIGRARAESILAETYPKFAALKGWDAIDGLVGASVYQGKNIDKVLKEFSPGLDTTQRIALQFVAINGRCGQRVREGEPPSVVAEQAGIEPVYARGLEFRTPLPITGEFQARDREAALINGIAGDRVLTGESSGHIAREYGIKDAEMLLRLDMLAASGPAAAQVLRGANCSKIIEQYGITHIQAQRLLENLSVEGPGKAAIRKGQSVDNIKQELGLTLPEQVKALTEFEASHRRRWGAPETPPLTFMRKNI